MIRLTVSLFAVYLNLKKKLIWNKELACDTQCEEGPQSKHTHNKQMWCNIIPQHQAKWNKTLQWPDKQCMVNEERGNEQNTEIYEKKILMKERKHLYRYLFLCRSGVHNFSWAMCHYISTLQLHPPSLYLFSVVTACSSHQEAAIIHQVTENKTALAADVGFPCVSSINDRMYHSIMTQPPTCHWTDKKHEGEDNY